MSASLVGSEMCIRDRTHLVYPTAAPMDGGAPANAGGAANAGSLAGVALAVAGAPRQAADLGARVGGAVKTATDLNSAYARLVISELPAAGKNQTWLRAVAAVLAQSSGFLDEADVPWIDEIT
eukprot:3481254-Alexandrium_andersonii.AAC.1